MTSPGAVDTVGELQLFPGRPLPTLASSRRDVAPLLARGRPAADWPRLAPALFTLCSHAHRLAASLALRVAQAPAGDGGVARPDVADRQALRLATAREQVLRIAQSWPPCLPDDPPVAGAVTAALLDACPLWRGTASDAQRLAALPGWLAERWLGQPVDDWLQALGADTAGWPLAWAQRAAARPTSDTPLAALLRRLLPAAQALATPECALRLPDTDAAAADMMRAVAEALATRPGFCLQPVWQDRPHDTGPWSRAGGALPAADAAQRLSARLADLLRLAAPGGDGWLRCGALALPDRRGIAWTEMARGLLVHALRLAGEPGAETLAEVHVLAPTEWNCHPHGGLARALVAVGTTPDAQRLAVAYDPCVPIRIAPIACAVPQCPNPEATAATPAERGHA